jgi:hypothetical protein
MEVMMGITAAPIIPAKAPRPDITPNAAPKESAAKLTVRPDVISGRSLLKFIFKILKYSLEAKLLTGNRLSGHNPKRLVMDYVCNSFLGGGV